MGIISFDFLFFVFFFLIAYLASWKIIWLQKTILVLGSIFFIMSYTGGIATLAVIIIISALTYIFGILIEKAKQERNTRNATIFFALSCCSNIGVLLYFKYFTFIWRYLQAAFVDIVSLDDIIVPLGISYFTLSIYAYLSDVKHGKIEAEKNPLDILCFVLFFPSLIEGPINLYKKLSPQLKQAHSFDWDRSLSGLQRILWGVFKKLVIADRIGIISSGILADENTRGAIVIYAMTLYSFQIYADFSGGIDVIMGITEIMGIQLTENFSQPLMAKSVTEFWKRWHKSLGEWMEKYVYYPIVLNKKLVKGAKKLKSKYLQKVLLASIGSFIVFVIVGIWHGTGWNYVIYGCYQAFFVSTATFLSPVYKNLRVKVHLNESCISWKLFTILRTFVILLFGRVLTRAGSLDNAIAIFRRIFASTGIRHLFNGEIYNYGLDWKNVVVMNIGILILIIVDLLHERKIHFRELLMKQDICFRYVVYLLGLFAVIIYGIYGPEFDASSFIYAGF